MRAAVCRTTAAPRSWRSSRGLAGARVQGRSGSQCTSAAINFPDVLVIDNTYQMSVPTPFITGSEFAGHVVEVGEGVDGRQRGRPRLRLGLRRRLRRGGRRAGGLLTPIPAGVDDRAAAAFGVAYKTAYHVLRSVAALEPGEELVVLGPGGGVGSAAVQLGAALGATVTAVASAPRSSRRPRPAARSG